MAALYSVFFDEPLATFSKICRALGDGSYSHKPAAKPDYSPRIVRVYRWPCGCRALICRGDRCGIALCDRHGDWIISTETAS
jgi:hypothetical protein